MLIWESTEKEKNEDTILLNILLESLLLTAVVESHKVRDVSVCNIPGAYLSSYMY